jgi:hypothetical protein
MHEMFPHPAEPGVFEMGMNGARRRAVEIPQKTRGFLILVCWKEEARRRGKASQRRF